MATDALNNKKVDPKAFYSDDDLKTIWGIQHAAQRQARESGALAGSPVGTGWLYSGEAVESYFQSLAKSSSGDSNTSTPSGSSRSSGSPGAVRQSVFPQQPEAPMSTSNQKDRDARTVKIFNSAIETQMLADNCDRTTAMKKVVRKNPAAHQEYLKATNRHRPGALRALEGVT